MTLNPRLNSVSSVVQLNHSYNLAPSFLPVSGARLAVVLIRQIAVKTVRHLIVRVTGRFQTTFHASCCWITRRLSTDYVPSSEPPLTPGVLSVTDAIQKAVSIPVSAFFRTRSLRLSIAASFVIPGPMRSPQQFSDENVK